MRLRMTLPILPSLTLVLGTLLAPTVALAAEGAGATPRPAPSATAGAPGAEGGLDLAELEKRLKGEGVEGSIHGAVQGQNLYVFTYRVGGNFFNNVEFPIIPRSPEVAEQLRKLQRHDTVLIKGAFLENGAPIRHIALTEVRLLKAWKPGDPTYEYQTPVPADLLKKKQLVGKVHVVVDGGRVLVVDYKDRVFPVVVHDASLARGLYRGDKIRLRYTVQKRPKQPLHIQTDRKAQRPLEVLSKMVDQNGQKKTLEGLMVLYPQSPQIRFDVYALQRADPDGVEWDYTLVHFENPETFARIRKKLEDAWKASEKQRARGRNKWVNPRLKVKATGTINVQAPNQANPQILLNGPEDVEITPVP